jgi:hypothetical protein
VANAWHPVILVTLELPFSALYKFSDRMDGLLTQALFVHGVRNSFDKLEATSLPDETSVDPDEHCHR